MQMKDIFNNEQNRKVHTTMYIDKYYDENIFSIVQMLGR